MPIISGLNNKAGKVIVIDESDWSVEANEDVTAQPDNGYEITVAAGQKLVVFRQSTGEIEAYGNVTAYEPPLGYDPLYYDDSYWENYGETWQAQFVDGEWVSGLYSYNIELRPIGSWAIGFRPTSVRIYYDGDWSGKSGNIMIRGDQSYDHIIGQTAIGTYTSGSNISLSFTTHDIGNLYIPTASDTLSIKQIEFSV